jgi:hypothetical protein
LVVGLDVVVFGVAAEGRLGGELDHRSVHLRLLLLQNARVLQDVPNVRLLRLDHHRPRLLLRLLLERRRRVARVPLFLPFFRLPLLLLLPGVLDEDSGLPDLLLAGVRGLNGGVAGLLAFSFVKLAGGDHVADDISVDLESFFGIELLLLQHGDR